MISNTDINQGQKMKRQLETCVDVQRLTLTFSNLHVAQVGKSNELVNEVEPCCNHRCERKQVKPANEEDDRLKRNSTSDEATGEPDLDPAFSTEALIDEAENYLSTLPINEKAILQNRQHDAERRTKEVIGVEYVIPLIKKQGSIAGLKGETVMKKLERLQDDGRFEAHEKYACAMLESSATREEPDLRATLMIERGIAFYYANDLRKCKQYFNIAIRMEESLINRELIKARALFLKSAAYRREKKHNSALQCLEEAEFLLSHHESGEEKGWLYYNYGNFWLEMYSTKSSNNNGREIFREKAKTCFENAIEHGSRDKNLRVQLKKKRYYNLKIAALYLDCSSKAARKAQQVHNEDVEEAKKRLDFVEYQLGDNMPLGTRVQLLQTRSDQHYRQGSVRLAIEVAEEGLEIAEKLEKNSSTGMLRERIEELQAMETTAWPRKTEAVAACMSDSGWSGDCCSD